MTKIYIEWQYNRSSNVVYLQATADGNPDTYRVNHYVASLDEAKQKAEEFASVYRDIGIPVEVEEL